MMHVKFSINSLEKYLAKMADELQGVDIDAAVVSALDEIGDTLLADMRRKVEPHKRTGKALSAVKRRPVESAGNTHYVEVGAMDIRGVDKDGFHVIYQEYGSPTLPADPWLRPALERLNTYKNKVIKDHIARHSHGQ